MLNNSQIENIKKKIWEKTWFKIYALLNRQNKEWKDESELINYFDEKYFSRCSSIQVIDKDENEILIFKFDPKKHKIRIFDVDGQVVSSHPREAVKSESLIRQTSKIEKVVAKKSEFIEKQIEQIDLMIPVEIKPHWESFLNSVCWSEKDKIQKYAVYSKIPFVFGRTCKEHPDEIIKFLSAIRSSSQYEEYIKAMLGPLAKAFETKFWYYFFSHLNKLCNLYIDSKPESDTESYERSER